MRLSEVAANLRSTAAALEALPDDWTIRRNTVGNVVVTRSDGWPHAWIDVLEGRFSVFGAEEVDR